MVKQRIRSAVILGGNGKILLVKHVDPVTKKEWWIPPGGGLMPEDQNIIECASREVHEETGLEITVGRLIYVREFVGDKTAAHNLELFFLGEEFSGEMTIKNIIGSGIDEEYVKGLAWLDQEEMKDLVVYPEHLKGGFWQDLEAGFPEVQYLGFSSE